MTRLRSAVVLVTVVLFTLALGIALGGGLLQGDVSDVSDTLAGDPQDSASDEAPAGPTPAERQRRRAATLDRRFSDAVAPRLLAGELAARPVLLVALPGVGPRTVRQVSDDVRSAGGRLTTSLRVGRELVDPAARALTDELSSRLARDLSGPALPSGLSVYQRTGTVLARVLLTTRDGRVRVDEAGLSVLDSFRTAGLVEGPEPSRRASLTIVLAPGTARRSDTAVARGTIVSELTTALDSGSDGTVLAAATGAARPGGLLTALRDSPEAADAVSTVEAVDARSGQVASVLSLVEQSRGGVGHYGLGRHTDGVLPGAAGGA